MNFKAILFPTDFSSSSQEALQYASVLAAESGATLYLLHVIDESAAYCTEYTGMGYLADLSQRIEHESKHLLSEVEPTVPDVNHERILMLGAPARTIVRLAEEKKVDLIVMGSHGRTGFSRLLMGSVAEHVVREAPCPVLTVKQPVVAETADSPQQAEEESTAESDYQPGKVCWQEVSLATREGTIP